MSHYAKNPYEEPEPPRCPTCDECETEVFVSGQAIWKCLNPLCEDSIEYDTEKVELDCLRKIMKLADIILTRIESDSLIYMEDRKQLRIEIEKVKAL